MSRTAEIINRRRRQIIAHSCLYYRMNTSIVSDHVFDAWSAELAQLQRDYPEQARQCVYAEEFAGFDGSSGFDLAIHYPEVIALATYILRIHNKRNEAVI